MGCESRGPSDVPDGAADVASDSSQLEPDTTPSEPAPGQCLNLLYYPPKYEPCCPDPAPPDCIDKPEGYPGFFCTPNCAEYPDAGWPCSLGGSYCTCRCQDGAWRCGC